MIIRIQKPTHLGEYKLNKQAARVAMRNMINKQIKFVRSFGQKVSAVIIYDEEREYKILINK